MSDKIHACAGLDRLVAEEVKGWRCLEGEAAAACLYGRDSTIPAERRHTRRIWLLGADLRACEECGNLPHWSSAPGEALRLLEEENRRSPSFCWKLSLFCRNEADYRCATIRDVGLAGLRFWDEEWFPTPALAIVVRVLTLHEVSQEEMEEACLKP